MLTQNEITALSLSPTKKDFVQIWNELLEVAGKLSERWDPTSTNESDPGIVILKALTGIADKLNYNIDKNILEAFMPTAAQEDSMRKLCDMLGYNMKYYRSAETDVTIKYYNPDPSDEEAAAMAAPGQLIPKFTVITNSDKDISYFTINQSPVYISAANSNIPAIPCMEGQIVKCESSNDNNVITVNQISENNRFYLPETMVAENGIFIYNIVSISDGLADGASWTKVDNLNTQARESRVFKFGYDSYESRPYVEFPEDYSKLFNDGIFLYYARTNGVNGNVSPRTLTQIELPSTDGWANVSADSINVENTFAATSGTNAETIKQAYNNFKKTIGTFETLVTCRDYMNKIYTFIESGKPLVSNILVTDMRSDINSATTICSCDESGIFYKEVPVHGPDSVTSTTETIGNETIVTRVVEKTRLIDHFDIVFYPFKSYNQIRSNVKDIRAVYDSSFTYVEGLTLDTIKQRLEAEETKTISHSIRTPNIGDVLSINNYLRLNATIATNSKVTVDESTVIIDNIKKALANAFNMRELDFGDEIPFDSIVSTIESADTRIKVASLNEPALYTTFSVLEKRDKSVPVISEYAVASDWLDTDMAEQIGRFTKVSNDGEVISTFNTDEARKIYNKLAVRNVLAGRVPLFNYNNSFKASFSEGAYQVSTKLPSRPANLAEPTLEDPYTIWTEFDTETDQDVIYTGHLDSETGDKNYLKTTALYKDNSITETRADDKVTDYITDIKADCKLLVGNSNLVTDVTLADGEFVKFRAPNFTTIKTYPAYVNYHLDLAGKSEVTSAVAAKAKSLFNILDSDRNEWSLSNTDIKWQKVLEYFKNISSPEAASYVKTFTISQTVSAFKTEDDNISIQSDKLSTTIGVGVDNIPIDASEYTIESLVARSGCVKLTNDGFSAHVKWAPLTKDETPPSEDVPLELVLEDFTNPFITNVNVLTGIKSAVDTALATYRDSLPTECSFTVSFDFECVPFEPSSLPAWEGFIRECSDKYNETWDYQILEFNPVDENNTTILWRLFGEGYEVGKYVTSGTEKLLNFDANYFELLPTYYLKGIYLVEDLGADTTPVIIKNNEEYCLGQHEYLYIEYTPSSTTGETTNNSQAAVTEVYGAGTIIRPSGFETGLIDSDVYTKQGVSPHKTVTFMTADRGSVAKAMHRFGASEQVEIRDFANVTLSADTLSDIYIYKNFNGELERAGSTYTLRDGEAVFYTDQNKAEFAYFTSGTEVTLSNNVELPQFDIIELSTILESGLQEIPWSRLTLNTGDTITFQEYQYITLGPADTIKSLVVIDPEVDQDISSRKYLSDSWKYCSDVEYVLAGEPDTAVTLPTINLQGERDGCGWEACSTLELAVSTGIAQTLRSTDKVETSLILSRTDTTGGSAGYTVVMPKAGDEGIDGRVSAQSLSFKTNLVCQSCGNAINIGDVWFNPDSLKGFQLKVFASDEPVIVKTKPNKVAPYSHTGDIATWGGDPIDAAGYREPWRQVDLDDIKVANGTLGYDNALRLSVSLLPNTYGIFCIYIDYTSTDAAKNAKTWIEVLPGTGTDDLSLINAPNQAKEHLDSNSKKLYRLYLNSGINCVRINKTSRIFIKTSQNAQGTLYFDELQLVNSELIEYTAPDKSTISINTKGLNLAQLGYLDTTVTSDNSIDMTTKTALQKACVDELYSSVNSTLKGTEDEIANSYNELITLLPKVQLLVDAESLIDAELATIKTLDSTRRSKLTSVYKRVSEALEKERALQTALKNNTETDTLEQKLVALLDGFASIDASQQQVMSEFSGLSTNAEACLEKLAEQDIINDFQACSSEEREKALLEINDAVISKIEDYYQDQLAIIADKLSAIVNSPGKNALMNVLENLKTSVTTPTRVKLRAKVNELANLIESEIDSTVEEIVGAANQLDEPDYARLLTLLTHLRNIVDSDSIKVLSTEITRAVEESDDAQLRAVLEPLFKDGTFNKEALNAAMDADIIAAIDTVYTTATNTASSTRAADTKEAVNDLKAAVSANYTTKLEQIFTGLNTTLNGLYYDISGIDRAMLRLAATEYDADDEEKSQATLVIKQLQQCFADRSTFIRNIAELYTAKLDSWETSSCSTFIREAIISIWPRKMHARLSALLSKINTVFFNTFNDTYDRHEANKSSLIKLYTSETDVLKVIIDTTAIEALFDSIKPLLSVREQSTVDTELISEISTLLLDSSELCAAVSNLSDNKVISAIISDWQKADSSNSVKQKQQLQSVLKDELAEAIHTNEQLFEVITSILCPNLTRLSEDPAMQDSFFTKFLSRLNTLKDLLKDNSTTDISICVDSACLDLLNLPSSKFRSMLVTFITPDDTLLPDTVLAELAQLLENIKTADAIAADIHTLDSYALDSMLSADLSNITVSTSAVQKPLSALGAKVESIEQLNLIGTGYEDAFTTFRLEEQLLADIRLIDVNREFYYNAPISTSLAIELNESTSQLNTLMNPQMYYDINNVNNGFVISKLDIDFLDSGLQIARSSRIN